MRAFAQRVAQAVSSGEGCPKAEVRSSETSDTSGVRVSVEELMRLRGEAGRLLPTGIGRLSNLFPGAYRALFRGRGLEFDEVRAYQPGDEYRALDWRVTARTGRLHTKLFKEEREHTLFIVLDAGPSMHFGTRTCFKWVLAARIAALFAWLAVESGDRVGVVLFGDGEHLQVLRPAGGQAGIGRLFRQLAAVPTTVPRWNEPANANAPIAALANVDRLARPGSSVLVLTDFYGQNQRLERHLVHLAAHNDVLAILVYDGLEKTLPVDARLAVGDGERRLLMDTHDKGLRSAFEDQFAARSAGLANLCRRQGLRFFTLGTQQRLVEGLRAGLFPREEPVG